MCLVAVRLDGGKLLRLDNESGFVKEEHLTDLGRGKWGNEMNGVCLACWDRLAEETQPARDGYPGEPPEELVLELLNEYSTRSEDSIMGHLRLHYGEEEGDDQRSRAYFENNIRRVVERLKTLDQEDKDDHARTNAARRLQEKKPLQLKRRKLHDELRRFFRDELRRCFVDMDETPDDSPILIAGEGAIDSEFIKDFMETHSQVQRRFGWKSSERSIGGCCRYAGYVGGCSKLFSEQGIEDRYLYLLLLC